MLLGFSAGHVLAARGGVAEVRITAPKEASNAEDGVLVNVSISNPNRSAIKILRYFTPVDGIKQNLFDLSVNGQTAEYIGPDYKRPAPTEKDYITLNPGESIDTVVDLAGFYDLSESGYYRISYKAEGQNIFSRDNNFMAAPDALSSNGVEVWVAGRETKAPDYEPIDNVAGTTTYTGCSTSRQSLLLTARNNAYTYSNTAYNYLNAGTTGSRYTTWFGVYNASRYSTVRSHFSSIRTAMNNAAVKFNCTCTDSAYAYVYPTQPYTIYLCNAFWSAPATGTDSKAGTLVHEMSHFNVVAGTDDWAYGQSAAKNLARTNPARAVDNADSHEYFAENTPSLP